MTANGKRVLVVDDEDIVCKSYERVLDQAGFEVDKAHSGAEALEGLLAHDYDVMLTDLKMPTMDGLETVRLARQAKPDLPVVVITGYPSQDTLNEAAQLGVSDYLTKPITPAVLTAATAQALAPGWGRAPPHRFQPAMAQAAAIPMPVAAAPLVWPPELELPARPEPRRRPVAKAPAKTVERTEAKAEPGTLNTLLRLAAAPVVSLAYVLFLPFLGFAVFLGMGCKALYRQFGGAA